MLPILHRTDRASMFASIEARVPFLDHTFVEMTLRIPPRVKMQIRRGRLHGKVILKRIAARYLPEKLVYRTKMGFQVPYAYYAGPWPNGWLAEGFVRSTFHLNGDALPNWLASLDSHTAFMALALEIWGQLFVRSRSVEEVNEEFLAVGSK